MRRENESVELIEVGGTWYEIGRQYGEACSEKIKKNVELFTSGLSLLYKADKEEAISMAQKFLEPAKEYAPDLIDEMKGIAEGANVSFEEVFFINAEFELDQYYPLLGGCTSFAATGEATKNGETIIGQNYDWAPETESVILRVQPAQGQKALLWTWAGALGQVGINSAGIGHNLNLILSKSSGVGVPFPVINRKVLQQKNIGDTIGVIYTAPRSASWNYLMATFEGDIVDVEVIRDDINVLYPERGIIVHSNHFVTEKFQGIDLIGSLAADSYLRLDRLTRLMEKHHGELSVDVMKELLQDHNDYPDSICRHIDKTGPLEEYFCTLVSIISLPGEGKMYVAAGNPCENEYVEYKL